MKTFDFAAAWRNLARPAFQSLPAEVLALLDRVAVEARELHQRPDLTMAWPEDGGDLRAAFEAIDPDILARAAHVVYCTGHWWPSNGRGVELPGREHGAHWKFSHYADQVLRRVVLQTPTDADSDGKGLTFQIHDGVIRLCYSSRNMWTWVELGPASPAGLAHAQTCRATVAAALARIPRTHVNKRDSAAYTAIEALRAAATARPELFDTSAYMVEEGDQAPDPDAPPPDVEAGTRAAIAKATAHAAEKIAALEAERDGRIWWLKHGIPVDNLIRYSDHWCFGWRSPVGPALLGRILDVISEFPEPYAIKTSDGRTLTGNRS